ncbi:MAG: hypothetical protein N4A71_00330 [Carboxylicivirga sp.]|jgi:hypothetical protein|nr:hypothetical protein [Carboxylicivirga sp.]
MSQDLNNIVEKLQSIHKMNKGQLLAANYILDNLKGKFGDYRSVNDRYLRNDFSKEHGVQITDSDIDYVLDLLKYKFYFVSEGQTPRYCTISQDGFGTLQEHENFISYLVSDYVERVEAVIKNQEEELQEQKIKELTIKQLRGNIFQVKWWWMFLLINAVLSFGVAIAVKFIFE